MAKNIIIGQSGGPTAVINSSLAGVYIACGYKIQCICVLVMNKSANIFEQSERKLLTHGNMGGQGSCIGCAAYSWRPF